MHSMQAGYLEKAQKYTDKALMQLEKLKSERQSRDFPDFTVSPVLLPMYQLVFELHRVSLADTLYPLCSCYPR
jgi:hypothetical protein